MSNMDHLELLEDFVLGEGSFGKVYKCHWYGSVAAAKKFNFGQADENKEIMQEIELLKNLQNDYIIQFFGSINYHGSLCLVTSFAEKGTLYRALRKKELSPELKASIISGMLEGMLYLQNRGVVHRDLKSANVLLDKNYMPKICDFGLAMLKMTSSTNVKTAAAMGTTRWMAPELLSTHPRYSFASDVYALGLVIWEIYTEKIPYQSIVNDAVIMDAIKRNEHEVIPSNIPVTSQQLMKSCWAPDPKDRITVKQLKEEFDKTIQPTESKALDTVFDDDIPLSLADLDLDDSSPTRSLPMTQPSFNTSRYTTICEQYSGYSRSGLSSSDRLVSVLNEQGQDFVDWLKSTADLGQSASQTMLGEMYFHGCGVPQDLSFALKYFDLAAQQGYPRSQYCLGFMYATGRGVEQNDTKAVELYTKAAKQGDAAAQSNLGLLYANGQGVKQSYSKAVEMYTRAAEQGYAAAASNLGLMYENGQGVERNEAKAAELYASASRQGNSIAQTSLGILYEYGRGIEQNYANALELYSAAADQGFHVAQNNLGILYEKGRGVEQDYQKAAELYAKAVEQGYAIAQSNLGFLYENGFGVEQSDAKAVELYTKAADQGNVIAQNNLGFMYENGRGVKQSYKKAVEMYTIAAEQGIAAAQINLGLMYLSGQGVDENHKKAAGLFAKAAEQDDARGQYCLGFMYMNGLGVKQNDKKAVDLYAKAVKQDNARAQYCLGLMYEKGRGVHQGFAEAAELYAQAAGQGDLQAKKLLQKRFGKKSGCSIQ